MGKLIVVGTKVFIRLDGADIQTSSTYHGDVLEVKVPARMKATQNKKAFRLHEEGVYLLLSESWNAKDSWEIRDTTRGASLVWEYGDHHGMRGGALFIIESEQFQIDYDVPGHHGHTVEKYRLIGDTSGQYKIQERLDLSDIEELPAGKTKPADRESETKMETKKTYVIRNDGKQPWGEIEQRFSYTIEFETGRVTKGFRAIIHEFTFPLETTLPEICEKIREQFYEIGISQLPNRAYLRFHGDSQNEGEIKYFYGKNEFPEYRVEVFRSGDKLVAELY